MADLLVYYKPDIWITIMGKDMKETVGFLLFCFILLCHIDLVNAQSSTCDIDAQKKDTIKSILCGQAAPEAAYRFSGDGCAKKSIQKRLEDSAIQIHMYSICGDKDFANQIRMGTLLSMKFIEKLLPCTGEILSLENIMSERIQYVKKRADGITCDAMMKAKLKQRRAFFEKTIEMANNTEVTETIFQKLGVKISDNGSVIDMND